jgi:hypothetical protein
LKVKVDKGQLIEKEFAAELRKLVEHFRRTGLLGSDGRNTSALVNGPAIYVRNDDATEAPPFACMQVIGTVEVGEQNYLKVDKPIDGDGAGGWFVFNGPSAIPSGDFGVAYGGPLCRMLTDGSTVTAGETWGPVSGQWTIEPGGVLFVAAGEDDIATDVMRGFFKGGGGGASLYAARMTENWTSRQATCEIYTLDGANDPVYVDDQEVYDPLSIFAALGVDDWLKVGLNPDGKYYVVAANCPGTSPLIADPPATQP